MSGVPPHIIALSWSDITTPLSSSKLYYTPVSNPWKNHNLLCHNDWGLPNPPLLLLAERHPQSLHYLTRESEVHFWSISRNDYLLWMCDSAFVDHETLPLKSISTQPASAKWRRDMDFNNCCRGNTCLSHNRVPSIIFSL